MSMGNPISAVSTEARDLAAKLAAAEKRIAATEAQHAKALWAAHKVWIIACAALFIGGFVLGKLM